MIHEVDQSYIPNIFRNIFSSTDKELQLNIDKEYYVIPTSSGKASLHLILCWLRQKNILANKTEEVLVPQWLGNWVYKTIHANSFPSTTLTKETRAVLIYHQYGFLYLGIIFFTISLPLYLYITIKHKEVNAAVEIAK